MPQVLQVLQVLALTSTGSLPYKPRDLEQAGGPDDIAISGKEAEALRRQSCHAMLTPAENDR